MENRRKDKDLQIDETLTPEDEKAVLISNADNILEGIIAAAKGVEEETQEIVIARNGKKYFRLVIKPIDEGTARKLRKRCTKYKKDRRYGVTIQDSFDSAMYNSLLIYEATVNKEETWDNKQLWKSLEERYPIVSGYETIDLVLLAGEKDKLIDAVNELSGYRDDDTDEEGADEIETIKNS